MSIDYSKFATKDWYFTDSKPKGGYFHHDSIKFLKKSIKSRLCILMHIFWLQEA